MRKEQPSRLEPIAFLGLYLALTAVWHGWIRPFEIPYGYWQFLPAEALANHYGRALLNLHSQPPVMNALLGLALHVERWTGLAPETLLSALQIVLGGSAVLALWAVSTRLLPVRPLRIGVLLLVLLNPVLYASLAIFFYTAYELVFLAWTAWAAARFWERPGAGRWATALAPAVLLVYTRALFHPLWFFGFAALGLVLARPRWPILRACLPVTAIAAGLVLAWPAKNLQRFGFFGYSSWSGYNASRGLPLPDARMDTIDPRRLSEPDMASALQATLPPALGGEPGISELRKADGSVNWNHYAVLLMCREAGRQAAELLEREPAWLLRKAALFYTRGFSMYEGRNTNTQELSSDMQDASPWPELYERVVFQPLSAAKGQGPMPMVLAPGDPTPGLPTGFAYLFPLVLALCAVALARGPRAPGAHPELVAFMLLSVSWVFAITLLVDGFESNRARYSTEPFLFLLAAWLVQLAVLARCAPSRDSPA